MSGGLSRVREVKNYPKKWVRRLLSVHVIRPAVSAKRRLSKLGFCPHSEGKSAWEAEALFFLSDYISKEWFSGP